MLSKYFIGQLVTLYWIPSASDQLADGGYAGMVVEVEIIKVLQVVHLVNIYNYTGFPPAREWQPERGMIYYYRNLICLEIYYGKLFN